MGKVPHDYLLWLLRQDWITDWPDVHAYLIENQSVLLAEASAEQPEGSDGFTSYDDYMRYGRD